jgi:hypothetical protein
MVVRYRALLIGNSTYPADEHNLQQLRGPVKDIAAVNRALIDKDTGLFADADVTLLPEVTSTRALRALGKFFAGADRDDVLLMYFSGHGKLDQNGRLHLCMQDTETTDLLSTAVSNVRINEFADASRARNIVLILDCCYAGAFRGADLGDAVAGPGRYVLSSCRGTQLANDATVDNGTSFFTQHLVDGLLTASDSDQDGYVSFSDLYAYVDHRLREEGKQIPARRVDGDGDLWLAKRPRAAAAADATAPLAPADPMRDGAAGPLGAMGTVGAAGTIGPVGMAGRTGAAGSRSVSEVGGVAGAGGGAGADGGAGPGGAVGAGAGAGTGTGGGTRSSSSGGSRAWWTRRRVLAAVLAVVVVAGGAAAALLIPGSAGSQGSHGTAATGTYTATAPWRLRVDGTAYGNGCTVTLTNETTGEPFTLPGDLYSVARFQVPSAGTFRWQANDSRCLITPFAGSGTARLPLLQVANGDTDAITTPGKLAIHIDDNRGGNCRIQLSDAANGQALDLKQWEQGDTQDFILDPSGRRSVYVSDDNCAIRVSAARG